MTTTTNAVPFLPRERIETEARQVLQRFGITALPIEPLTIAVREGIAVLTVTFVDQSLSGSISVDGSQTTIRVSRADAPSRKRYTIAHELGHYYLHLVDRRAPDGEAVDQVVRQFTDGTNNLFRQPSKIRPMASDEARREFQANLFAAALLMPEDRVRRYWQDYDSIAEMARVFEVSELAMSIRLGQLGLLDE